MLKKVRGGLLVLAILGCVVGVATGEALVYILSFVILVLAILFGLMRLAIELVWKFLPSHFKQAHEGKTGRFSVVIFFCLLFYYTGSGVIDKLYLRGASGFISPLGNMTTLIFAVFLGWTFIRRSKGWTIVAGSIVFMGIIALLSFISSNALKSGEMAEKNLFEKLGTLGYVDWVPAKQNIEKTGVTRYETAAAFAGINLYTSRPSAEAYLIDMRGNIVHRWARKIMGASDWAHVELCRNGDLLAIAKDQMLIRLDWNSKVKWKKKMRVHHDISFDEDQKIYVIVREDGLVFWHGIPVPILSDYIEALSTDGKTGKKVYIYDLVKDRVSLHSIVKIYCHEILKPANLLKTFYYKVKRNYLFRNATSFDITHLNSIEIMDRSIEGFCNKGDWLICLRELDLVGIVDAKKEKFVWSWGPGELSKPHHPTLLKNGNVLIFDNGCKRRFSRIVELNPLTNKIAWEYRSEPAERFFSETRGSSQRLPNGNTLIAESDKGRVFEVTEAGEVVWEFYNPDVRPEDKTRAAIYRMIRITKPGKYGPLLKFR